MSAPIADRSSLRSAGIAAIALALGFSAILHPAAQDLFQRLAGLLARLAEAGLSLSTFEVMRNGTELRNAVTGFAVDVTRACDGHGILICWAAVLLVLPGRWQARLLAFAAGFVAIQAFNLVRVVVLFAASPAGSPLFDTLHYFAFPLATSALILALAAWRQPHLRWPAVLAVAALCVAAPVWFFLSGPLGAALLVPAANAVLAMTAPPEIGSIALRAAGWTVSSDLIQTTQPLRLYLAPLYPGDFALALPALAAAGLIARRGLGLALIGLAAMPVALALAGIGAIWDIAAAHAPVLAAVPAGDGRVRAEAFAPPPDALRSGLKLAQNVIVHFNLLVLPVLILQRGASGDARPSALD